MKNLFSENESEIRKQMSVLRVIGPRRRKLLALVAMTTVLGSVLEALSIAAVIPVIAVILDPNGLAENRLVAAATKPIGSPRGDQLVVVVMIALGLLFLFKNIALAAITWFQTRFRESVERFISDKLFDDYLHRPYEWICQVPSAVLLRNLNESRAVVDYSLGPKLVLTTEATVTGVLFLMLFLIEPLGSVLVAAIVGIGGGVFLFFSKKFIRRLGAQKISSDAMRIQIAQEAIAGLRELRLYRAVNLVSGRYRRANQSRIEADQRYTFASTLPIFWLEMILMCGLVVLTITLVSLGRSSDSIMAFLALFTAAAFRILPSANRVVTSVQALKFGKSQLDVILTDLNFENDATSHQQKNEETTSGAKVNPSESLICFEDVSFGYQGSADYVLSGITMEIKNGERVGIVGKSGSGKTTLISLMVGLLRPSLGTVYLQGQPLTGEIDDEAFKVAYVSQDPYIIEGSLMENIVLGHQAESTSPVVIREILDSLGLRSFSLDDYLYEQGRSLSGGQKQRLSIARALVHKPDLLILDEPTSSVDDVTEQEVNSTIKKFSPNCTTVVVTHRRALLENCDKIYEIRDGALINQ
jgi:ATP-binding cassette, subfamily B, bacterial PglK